MSRSIPRLSFDQVIDRLIAMKEPFHESYLAMYSSWYGGIVVEPSLMMVPIDDHLVHRGDGVFEAFKCVGGNVYALDRHLARIERSAAGVSLTIPMNRQQLLETILATIRAANVPDCIVRLFVSRGPGGFSTNPYECPSSQLYLMITALQRPPDEKYERGVKLKSSHIPIKKSYFANLKSCNYLPNVLMRKEAEDAGVDFTVSIDEDGYLGEGATENVGIITKEGQFLVPRFERILRGITVTRVLELAHTLVDSGELTGAGEASITPDQTYTASEVMMFGTSFDILAVVDFDGRPIGTGRPGPLFKRFLDIMRQDMSHSTEMLTPVRE